MTVVIYIYILTLIFFQVTKVKVGDHIGVGCMVDSCLQCAACRGGEEQLCSKGNTGTYNGTNKYGRAEQPGGYTLGGYTSKHVVHEHFAVIIPKSYPMEFAGPVMCSGFCVIFLYLRCRICTIHVVSLMPIKGVTLFDPLRRYGAKDGKLRNK